MGRYSRRGFLWGTAAAAAAVPLALSGCARPTVASSDVKIAMGYVANVQFTPMYQALGKGYFEEENINVSLDYGWETDIVALVGADQLQFAIANGDQVMLARAQGLPVVYVFDWYNRFPVTVTSLAATGIATPQDLIGKRVGTPVTYGSSYIGWRALLYANGISEEQVELQTIGYTQVAALTSGQVDAAICFYMNEPVQLQQAGEAVNQIIIADYIDLPAAGIVTNEATIGNKPDLVRRVVRAFSRGLADTLTSPDDAFAAAEAAVPEIADSRDTQRAVLAACVELWRTDRIGWCDEAAWQTAAEFMKEAGLLDVALKASEAFSNDFLPEAT